MIQKSKKCFNMSVILYKCIHFIFKLSQKINIHYWNWYCNFYLKINNNIKTDILFQGHTILRISSKAHIQIGKSFICRSGINNQIDNNLKCKINVKDGAELTIGNYSGMSSTIILVSTKVEIGNYVNIGAGCIIFDTNFHSTDWKIRENRQEDTNHALSSPVIIKDHVFIGARSIICKGITIGEKSIIAAGSVVVSSVPPYEMWGGNPARFIKSLK